VIEEWENDRSTLRKVSNTRLAQKWLAPFHEGVSRFARVKATTSWEKFAARQFDAPVLVFVRYCP